MSVLKWKSGSIFPMDGGKAKLSQIFISMELFFSDAVDLVLSSEITNTLHLNSRQKAFPAKTPAKFNSFDSLLAESQEHHSL